MFETSSFVVMTEKYWTYMEAKLMEIHDPASFQLKPGSHCDFGYDLVV